MRKRWIRRRLLVIIFTFFIFVLVDFQLRTSNFPRINADHNRPLGAQQVPYEGARSSASNKSITSSLGESQHHDKSGGVSGSEGPHVTQPLLKMEDIYIAVKTTGRFHKTRLALLLETWISSTKTHTFIFTDTKDEDLSSQGYNLEVTSCHSDHSQQALSCKMAAEYDGFMASNKRWFCHVDDDNYVNPEALLSLLTAFPQEGDVYVGKPSLDKPITAHELLEGNATRTVQFWFATGGAGFCLSRGLALKMKPWASDGAFMATAEHIRLPDDCTVGYIVEAQLGVSLTRSPLFHSHLENLGLVSDVQNQVTLSYGTVENSRNTVNVKGPFSVKEDPTRFRSVHCLLYPDTSWCPSLW